MQKFAISSLLLVSLLALGADEIDERLQKADRPAAPELEGATAWINADKGVTMAQLKGKIVLMDFWTFG